LQVALRDHDAAMSQATVAFEAAFNEADELGGVPFNESTQVDDTSAEPEGDTRDVTAQSS
jgi:hypothetical protein